ncbi:MAG: hypothetical protein OWV35_04165 [Firmicutes bacterium]|nr:hypothetical protein [Bacillota bacterium]
MQVVVPSRVFEEMGLTLRGALRRLGYRAEAVTRPVAAAGPALVLGAQLLAPPELRALAPGSVLYNLEPLDPAAPWLTPPVRAAFRERPVWDYSRRNCRTWAGLGVAGPLRVPVGYVPELTRIPPAGAEDIEVLFYGTPNPRRLQVLEALRARGVRVAAAFGVWGPARDALIARARLVLNIHYHPVRIFEVVRVSYLLANRKAVVTECDPDTELDEDLRGAVRAVPYEGLVEACRELLANPAARRELGERGLAAMAARDETVLLARALAGRETD